MGVPEYRSVGLAKVKHRFEVGLRKHNKTPSRSDNEKTQSWSCLGTIMGQVPCSVKTNQEHQSRGAPTIQKHFDFLRRLPPPQTPRIGIWGSCWIWGFVLEMMLDVFGYVLDLFGIVLSLGR